MISRVRLERSPDLIARRILMSSVLYYGLDRPLVPDGQYDDWCRYVKHNWDDVADDRQWQLRSPEDVAVSGFDFRITRATIGGAQSWLAEQGELGTRVIAARCKWKWSERRQVEFLYPEDFKLRKVKS